MERSNSGDFEKSHIPWNRGIPMTKSIKEKISLANKGRIPWNNGKKGLQVAWNKGEKYLAVTGRNHYLFGKHLSKETKKKIGKKNKGRIPWIKGKTLSESHIKNIIKGSHAKPNKSELKLNIILQNILPKEYAINVLGDKLILGGKIPDFVNMNGQKKVIELFGKGFHKPSCFNDYKVPYKRTVQGRKRIFKRLGYNCLIIWGKELKNPVRLSEKLINFNRK